MLIDQISRQPAIVTALCGGLTVALMLIRMRQLRGTTLGAAMAWAIIAVIGISSVELANMWGSIPTGSGLHITLRYLAAITTFCPIMAVLGAKRPQHRSWQLIVLSLWCVLALPAAEAYFVRRGAAVQIHDARGWFLWMLLLVGSLNYVGTRHGISMCLVGAGQVLLLGKHLPVWPYATTSASVAAAMTLLLVGVMLVLLRDTPQMKGEPSRAARNPDQWWSEFRNLFGTFWALRISDRFNAHAALNDWHVRLGYRGFRSAESAGGDTSGEPRRFLRSLLSRFVSDEWFGPNDE